MSSLNGFWRLRRRKRRCVTSSLNALSRQLQAARRTPLLSLKSECSISLRRRRSLGLNRNPGQSRNTSPSRSGKLLCKLCWTLRLERKKRGPFLASAGTAPKTARLHSSLLQSPLSLIFSWPCPAGAAVPEYFTSVISDPQTLKSKLPYPLAITYTNVDSPLFQG